MLKFIRIHGVNVDLEDVRALSDEELEDAYFDLKSEQINVNSRLDDLRIDDNYDKVRESGLKSASRHIHLGIEFVASLRRQRKDRVSDRFMTKAREVLDADTFDRVYEAVR
jgi:ribosomal protein L29